MLEARVLQGTLPRPSHVLVPHALGHGAIGTTGLLALQLAATKLAHSQQELDCALEVPAQPAVGLKQGTVTLLYVRAPGRTGELGQHAQLPVTIRLDQLKPDQDCALVAPA